MSKLSIPTLAIIALIFAATPSSASFPSSFDLRGFNPYCPFTIYEEGMCASSWAIAVAGTVSDLQCEMYDKQIQLSP